MDVHKGHPKVDIVHPRTQVEKIKKIKSVFVLNLEIFRDFTGASFASVSRGLTEHFFQLIMV